jgi:hypothetical protein
VVIGGEKRDEADDNSGQNLNDPLEVEPRKTPPLRISLRRIRRRKNQSLEATTRTIQNST